MFKFSQALVVALILVAFALLTSSLTAPRVFLIVFYLLLATVFPWLMVPLGVVAIIYQLAVGGVASKIAAFTGNLTGKPAQFTQTGPGGVGNIGGVSS